MGAAPIDAAPVDAAPIDTALIDTALIDTARWERIQALFHEAVDLPAERRCALLDAECGNDEALKSEVLRLLDEDDHGSSLLDRGVATAADAVLGAEPDALSALGPYRMVRVIGEGGMGVVYLAERTDLESLAAVKILRDAWLSPARRDRFAAEQRTLAQLNHPSIARLFDAGTLPDGTPWIVMEYVDGVPLTDAARGRAVPERLRLFERVCEAVGHAHGHLVIHRDLKPSNVLVTAEDDVKLLDFGISKQLGVRGASADATRTMARLMTPAYAAPEQVRGEPVGVHTDVYSLGVVLYELLTGQLPFDFSTRTPVQAELDIVERTPERPSVVVRRDGGGPGRAVSAAAWADLDVLCLTAMHKDPARRYRTVEALARDVQHFLKGEPLEARPDTCGYRAGKFVRRNWRPLTATAAVVLTIVGLVVFYTARLTTARNAAVTEAGRTQRIQALLLNLFSGGDAEAGPSEDLRVATLVDRGVLEAQSLQSEPAVQAEMFLTLGGIYEKLGNLTKADTLLASALDRRRTIYGHDSLEVAESLVAQGRLRVSQAQFEDAARVVREGLAMTTRHAPPGDPAIARATTALGYVLVERGQYADAIRVLEQAVRLQEARSAESIDLAASLRQLANAHFYAGQYDAVDTISRRVLAMTRRLNGERHPLVAEDLINLGAAQFERGRYPDAERLYREALPITEGWYGAEHYQTASNLTMLGRALVYQKRFDEAVALLQRAVTIQERVFGPMHPRVASAVNDLGNVASQRGRYQDAEAAFLRMAQIYRAAYGAKHFLLATANSNLATVYVAMKDYGRAERLYRDAIAMYSETQSPTHINTGIGRLKLGRALLRQGRYGEAETSLLAGYDILAGQTAPAVSWLQAAREDLVATYDAMRQPEKAAKYRAEHATAAKP